MPAFQAVSLRTAKITGNFSDFGFGLAGVYAFHFSNIQ
jgi:hypothetical protein